MRVLFKCWANRWQPKSYSAIEPASRFYLGFKSGYSGVSSLKAMLGLHTAGISVCSQLSVTECLKLGMHACINSMDSRSFSVVRISRAFSALDRAAASCFKKASCSTNRCLSSLRSSVVQQPQVKEMKSMGLRSLGAHVRKRFWSLCDIYSCTNRHALMGLYFMSSVNFLHAFCPSHHQHVSEYCISGKVHVHISMQARKHVKCGDQHVYKSCRGTWDFKWLLFWTLLQEITWLLNRRDTLIQKLHAPFLLFAHGFLRSQIYWLRYLFSQRFGTDAQAPTCACKICCSCSTCCCCILCWSSRHSSSFFSLAWGRSYACHGGYHNTL